MEKKHIKKDITYEDIKKLWETYKSEELRLKEEFSEFFYEMNGQEIRSTYQGERIKETAKQFLMNQEKEERLTSNRLRFYKFHEIEEYNTHKSDKRYDLPDFLKIYKLQELPEKEDFNKLSNDEKIKLYTTGLEKLTVLSARLINVFNKKKNSLKSGGREAYSNKDINMINFLCRVKEYNDLVPDTKKIAFGFKSDIEQKYNEKNMKNYLFYNLALNASLPGYTRLSVHFGYQTMPILLEVNKQLKEKGLDEFPIDNYDIQNYITKQKQNKPWNPKNTIENLSEVMPYELDTFNVTTLGFINCDTHNGVKAYINQLKSIVLDKNGNIDENGIEDFICNIHPDLNGREIMYLAERARFGKSILQAIDKKIHQRDKNSELENDITKLKEAWLNHIEKEEIKEQEQGDDYNPLIGMIQFIKETESSEIEEKIAKKFLKYKMYIEQIKAEDERISDIIYDENEQFQQDNYNILMKYSFKNKQNEILEIKKSYEKALYEDMKKITENVTSKERDEVEGKEQGLLKKNNGMYR